MLDTTLATTFVPGTNVKGDVTGANWSYGLPRLALEQTLCLGAPLPTTLITLSRLSEAMVVICANPRQMRKLHTASQRAGLTNVHLLTADRHGTLPVTGESVDLVLIADQSGVRRLRHDRALLAQIQRRLKPEGLIYFEFGGPFDGLRDGMALNGLADGLPAPQLFWLTPGSGEMQTAVPLDDAETIRFFRRHSLYSPSIRLRGLGRVGRFLSRHPVVGQLTRRYGVLAGDAAARPAGAPPQYLRTIAQAAGVDISTHRWGLAAHGIFASRKVLVYLFPRTSASPEYVVKMTRDPANNYRLENARRALLLLHEKGIGDRETLPQAAFFGLHGGLAILGEKVIAGVPFRQQTTAAADCPYARNAIDWLVELGAATANSSAVAPHLVAKGLEALFQRFTQIYRLAPAHRDFLVGQLATIARSDAAFPLVFQHGDPGTWNVLVTPSGRAAFLDWEAAEPEGMPLWDLFYFIRSHGVWVSRTSGERDSLRGFSQHFLARSALSPILIEVTQRYCDQTGLSRDLVEPLFYTCWMHRALKEATRLTSSRLERGPYVSLLRLCIDQREAPTLQRLFSL